MKTKKQFCARWYDSRSLGTIGDVSFFARTDTDAKQQADRIGRQIGLPTSRREIHEGTRLVEARPAGKWTT